MITVTLTQEEIADRARSLAQYANRLAELADEEEGAKARQKQLMADIKERRLDISNELRRLSRAVRLGVEERTTQRVLFDEEQRMEEFRRERETEEQQQASTEAVAEFFGSEEALQTMLSLATGENYPIARISGWTAEQRRQASEWAKAAHLKANDHDEIEVPPMPEFLAAPDAGGTPFPTEFSQADINHMADYYTAQAIAEGKRVRICQVDGQPHVITSASSSRDAENWTEVEAWPILPLGNVGEENAKTYSQAESEYYAGDISDPDHVFTYEGIKINCGTNKKPDWWVIVGSRMTFTVKQEEKADDFTANRCDECKMIEGGHAPKCSKSDALTFDDYLAYSKAHYTKSHSSHARKMELTKMMDSQVREWKQQQAGNGAEPEPETKKKTKKLSLVEAAIDR